MLIPQFPCGVRAKFTDFEFSTENNVIDKTIRAKLGRSNTLNGRTSSGTWSPSLDLSNAQLPIAMYVFRCLDKQADHDNHVGANEEIGPDPHAPEVSRQRAVHCHTAPSRPLMTRSALNTSRLFPNRLMDSGKRVYYFVLLDRSPNYICFTSLP